AGAAASPAAASGGRYAMTASVPRKRLLITIAGGSLIVGMIVAAAWMSLASTADERARADEAVIAAEQLCEQVERAGGLCVVDPSNLRGEPGEPGEPGPAGRGIDSAHCASGTWTIRYSDGLVDYNAGPCTGDAGP